MPRPAISATLWLKMLAGGGAMCIGGPALVWYVMPSEEELFKRYNPELQRRSLERRQEKQEDFETFVGKLKEYSKSDKPIWTAWEADVEARRQQAAVQAKQAELERRQAENEQNAARRAEMQKSLR